MVRLRLAAQAAPPSLTRASSDRRHFLEARLPGLSEPVSAVALAGFRSLLRAPEAKMMLMTPLIMVRMVGFGALKRRR